MSNSIPLNTVTATIIPISFNKVVWATTQAWFISSYVKVPNSTTSTSTKVTLNTSNFTIRALGTTEDEIVELTTLQGLVKYHNERVAEEAAAALEGNL